LGNYEAAYPAYALINWPDALGHAHNYYLNLLAETGVPGLAAYLILWSAILWQSLRLLRRLRWPERGIVLGLTACWIALSVHHLVDKLYVNNIYIHLGVMLAMLQLLDPAVVGVRTHHQAAAGVYPDRGDTT
jgi:O-antigen ligase